LDSELISSAGIFHYGSISLISEPCRSTHLAALKIAKEANVVLSYDPNLRLPLWSSPAAARAGIMSIWQQANIIKVSDEEVKFLTSSYSCSTPAAASDADHVQTAAAVLHDDDNDDDDDETVLNCLWHPDLKLLLVTHGADGCRYYTPSFKGKVASLQVQAVDTTGAGDAFVAGLLSKLVQDFSLLQNEARLRQALQFANACGAITTTERGAIPALPDTHTVLRSLSSKLP
jgi:fructokinase